MCCCHRPAFATHSHTRPPSLFPPCPVYCYIHEMTVSTVSSHNFQKSNAFECKCVTIAINPLLASRYDHPGERSPSNKPYVQIVTAFTPPFIRPCFHDLILRSSYTALLLGTPKQAFGPELQLTGSDNSDTCRAPTTNDSSAPFTAPIRAAAPHARRLS